MPDDPNADTTATGPHLGQDPLPVEVPEELRDHYTSEEWALARERLTEARRRRAAEGGSIRSRYAKALFNTLYRMYGDPQK